MNIVTYKKHVVRKQNVNFILAHTAKRSQENGKEQNKYVLYTLYTAAVFLTVS